MFAAILLGVASAGCFVVATALLAVGFLPDERPES